MFDIRAATIMSLFTFYEDSDVYIPTSIFHFQISKDVPKFKRIFLGIYTHISHYLNERDKLTERLFNSLLTILEYMLILKRVTKILIYNNCRMCTPVYCLIII